MLIRLAIICWPVHTKHPGLAPCPHLPPHPLEGSAGLAPALMEGQASNPELTGSWQKTQDNRSPDYKKPHYRREWSRPCIPPRRRLRSIMLPQEMQSARQGPGAQQLPIRGPSAHMASPLATLSTALEDTHLQGPINLGPQSPGMRLLWDTFLFPTLCPLSSLLAWGSQNHPGLLNMPALPSVPPHERCPSILLSLSQRPLRQHRTLTFTPI